MTGVTVHEGSKERIGSLSGLSIETSVPLAGGSSLSSSIIASVGFRPLEFVQISSAGRLAYSRDNELDCRVETVLVSKSFLSFNFESTSFLSPVQSPFRLPSFLAHCHCFLGFYSVYLEYHLRTSFPKAQDSQSSDLLCSTVECSGKLVPWEAALCLGRQLR